MFEDSRGRKAGTENEAAMPVALDDEVLGTVVGGGDTISDFTVDDRPVGEDPSRG